ncbi:MAG TPA: DUF1761 domain-containing protein [Acidimicrobiia bacterium]|jgi:hypothetical protein
MILDGFDGLNWLAVIVATVAWFAFSSIWYSAPPISAAWQQAAKVTATGEGPPLAVILVPTFVGYFVTTVAIALVAGGIGASDFADGIALGVVLGLGFGVVGALIGQLYEQKGSSYWLLNGVNAIIAYSIVGAIVSVWD